MNQSGGGGGTYDSVGIVMTYFTGNVSGYFPDEF